MTVDLGSAAKIALVYQDLAESGMPKSLCLNTVLLGNLQRREVIRRFGTNYLRCHGEVFASFDFRTLPVCLSTSKAGQRKRSLNVSMSSVPKKSC